jgi:phosphoribosylaminoimidazole-succinocarboxamide synthase
MMTQAITETNFKFPSQTGFYKGKVRDVYNISNNYLVMVATDRISAFDVVLPRGIPYKGQVLNQIASMFLDATRDLVPNWKLACPDPVVTIGINCEPFPVEMVVRAYLSGSAWRTYKSGKREICGVKVPDGMKEHQKLPAPIITPTTKSHQGHDEDISREQILQQGLINSPDYELMEKYSLLLFIRGSEMAAKRGLILVDTKYEFGKTGGQVILIDEIHTPDSSRYFYANAYDQCFREGIAQKQLSKEFVREWLMANGFQGLAGQKVPEMTDDFVMSVSERYIELFEELTGQVFEKSGELNILQRIEQNISNFLLQHP